MPNRLNLGRVAFRTATYAVLFFLFFPILVTIVVSFNESGFVLPPKGLTLRWYVEAFSTNEFKSGMVVSLILGSVAAILANILSLPIALAMTRYQFRGKAILNLLVMSPLLIPVTILGLALYVFLVRIGLGSGLVTLAIGHTVVIMPFAVRLLTASLQNYDVTLEQAAMNVGASPVVAMLQITLPLIKAGLIGSVVMCFIFSWNDFAISIFLASADWIPLPIQIFTYIKFQYDAVSAAVVTTVIFLSAIMIAILDRVVGLRNIVGVRKT